MRAKTKTFLLLFNAILLLQAESTLEKAVELRKTEQYSKAEQLLKKYSSPAKFELLNSTEKIEFLRCLLELAVGYGLASVIKYGTPCFGLDTENILASTILHEHTHAGQAILMRTHGSRDRELYLAGGNPTPPTIPPPGTEGKEWAEMELPAHNNEWSSRYATGISYHSEYLSRVKDWLDFFDFLSKNAD